MAPAPPRPRASPGALFCIGLRPPGGHWEARAALVLVATIGGDVCGATPFDRLIGADLQIVQDRVAVVVADLGHLVGGEEAGAVGIEVQQHHQRGR